MHVYLLGINYKTAPVEIRELLRFSDSECAELIKYIKSFISDLELVVLSTCNRTEFYFGAADPALVRQYLFEYLKKYRTHASIHCNKFIRYELHGSNAIKHLFRVACGLESSVIGDNHILRQIKDAAHQADKLHSLDVNLRKIFNQAIRLGRKARHVTAINYGGASHGAAIARILKANDVLNAEIKNKPSILIIGAGKMARDIAKHLASNKQASLIFVNRTYGKAKELASQCSGVAYTWDSLGDILRDINCVITATNSASIILTKELLDSVSTHRKHKLFVIDVSLPRNVEACSVINLINIDSILEQNETILSERRRAIPAVERLIDECLANFKDDNCANEIERIIKSLYLNIDIHSDKLAVDLLDNNDLTVNDMKRFIQLYWKRMLHSHVHLLRSMKYNVSEE